MLRAGSGEPLVLLHGILCSERIWADVVPLLSADHEVIVPTLLGHNGGPVASCSPARIEHVVDDVEWLLDQLGLRRAHLAGNSLGGYVAIELARRGRASSVCALSPAGAWKRGGEQGDRTIGHAASAAEVLAAAVQGIRHAHAKLPQLAQSDEWRARALRYNAVHGERVGLAEYLALADDVLGCEIAEDLLRDRTMQLTPLDPPPCPITLAWSEQDRLFPVEVNGALARQLIPGARFVVLPDVGHIPMLDDPQLVAQSILTAARCEPLLRDPTVAESGITRGTFEAAGGG